jgi:hypothetical protein
MTVKTANIKSRKTWGFNPVSRVVPSKKIYKRAKYKNEFHKNIQRGY